MARFAAGKLNREEAQWLLDYFGTADAAALQHLVGQALNGDGFEETEPMAERQHILQAVRGRLRRSIAPAEKKQALPLRRYISYAAAILVFLSVGLAWYYFSNTSRTQEHRLVSRYGGDVMAGGNRATLMLADGSTVELSKDQSGIVVGGDSINYADGSAVLDTRHKTQDTRQDGRMQESLKTNYYVLSTPKGGQYKVVLPDGSEVWLNAASKLRYPSGFTGGERNVELEGEAYFRVSHDADRPFTVRSGGQSVTVLGTEFNINAYGNEPAVTTTLVSGSVAIKGPSQDARKLSPNQQAIFTAGQLAIREVDVEEYTAWKNGYFKFDGTELHTVLRQLERWYDIEVDYAGLPDRKLYAKIKRDEKLSNVLYMIEKTARLKFSIDERRLEIKE